MPRDPFAGFRRPRRGQKKPQTKLQRRGGARVPWLPVAFTIGAVVSAAVAALLILLVVILVR
jgi:hypothetical protein